MSTSRFFDRLAAVHRFGYGQAARFFLNQPGDAKDVFGALRRRQFAPRLVIRTPRFAHGAIDILGIGLGHLRKRVFRGRIDGLEPALRMRFDEFAANEKVVARLDGDVIGRLQ